MDYELGKGTEPSNRGGGDDEKLALNDSFSRPKHSIEIKDFDEMEQDDGMGKSPNEQRVAYEKEKIKNMQIEEQQQNKEILSCQATKHSSIENYDFDLSIIQEAQNDAVESTPKSNNVSGLGGSQSQTQQRVSNLVDIREKPLENDEEVEDDNGVLQKQVAQSNQQQTRIQSQKSIQKFREDLMSLQDNKSFNHQTNDLGLQKQSDQASKNSDSTAADCVNGKEQGKFQNQVIKQLFVDKDGLNNDQQQQQEQIKEGNVIPQLKKKSSKKKKKILKSRSNQIQDNPPPTVLVRQYQMNLNFLKVLFDSRISANDQLLLFQSILIYLVGNILSLIEFARYAQSDCVHGKSLDFFDYFNLIFGFFYKHTALTFVALEITNTSPQDITIPLLIPLAIYMIIPNLELQMFVFDYEECEKRDQLMTNKYADGMMKAMGWTAITVIGTVIIAVLFLQIKLSRKLWKFCKGVLQILFGLIFIFLSLNSLYLFIMQVTSSFIPSLFLQFMAVFLYFLLGGIFSYRQFRNNEKIFLFEPQMVNLMDLEEFKSPKNQHTQTQNSNNASGKLDPSQIESFESPKHATARFGTNTDRNDAIGQEENLYQNLENKPSQNTEENDYSNNKIYTVIPQNEKSASVHNDLILKQQQHQIGSSNIHVNSNETSNFGLLQRSHQMTFSQVDDQRSQVVEMFQGVNYQSDANQDS